MFSHNAVCGLVFLKFMCLTTEITNDSDRHTESQTPRWQRTQNDDPQRSTADALLVKT